MDPRVRNQANRWLTLVSMHSSKDLGGRLSAVKNADRSAIYLAPWVSPFNDQVRSTIHSEGLDRPIQAMTLSC